MVTRIIMKEKIRSQVLKVLSGYCFKERYNREPSIYILSPWISDVQLEIDEETIALNEVYFKTIYCIASVNLAHALLLLRIAFGVKVTLVTLPPSENFYQSRVYYIKNLLDFLDEIGCNIYLNPNLHAKCLLSNDFALIGSFNLSKAALYEREEIGVGIDDMESLGTLESYFKEVISQSEPYGYTVKLRQPKEVQSEAFGESMKLHIDREIKHHHFGLKVEPITEKLTRGWLFEDIVRLWGRKSFQDIQNDAYTFLGEWLQLSPYYDSILREVSSDLDSFYSRAFSIFLGILPEEAEEYLDYLHQRFGYSGKAQKEDILVFLNSKQARGQCPTRRLSLYSFKHPI